MLHTSLINFFMYILTNRNVFDFKIYDNTLTFLKCIVLRKNQVMSKHKVWWLIEEWQVFFVE
jgi:hypothetical protein